MKRENQSNDDSQDGSNNDGDSMSGGGGGGGGGNNKRARRNNDEQLRLLIPSRIAGAIIGKGGQHIQKLRTTYKCFVSVDDCQGPERTILVSSDFESIISIMKDVLKYYEERDGEVDVRVLIHQSLAGCVIGKGGSKIKEIRDKVGCRVLKVFPSTAPQSSDRVVQVIGKQEQCVEAVKEVLQLTKDTPIRGPVNSYDPINYDDMYAIDYGGYGVVNSNGGGGGGGSGGGGFRDRGDRYSDRGGRGGDRYNERRRDRSRSRGRDRDFISPWANDGPMGGGGGGGGSFGGFGSGGGSNSGGFGGFGGGFGGGNGPNFGSGGGNFGSGGFGGGNGPNFGSGGGGGSGFGGSGFGGGQGGNFGGGNMGMGNGNGNLGGMGGANSGGGGFGNSGGNMNGGNNAGAGGDGKNSTQVTIPKDLAGAIIGKNGQRIRRIRNESNAYITIDEPLPGSNDRIITISGNPKQIQMAQYLLQQSVLDSRK